MKWSWKIGDCVNKSLYTRGFPAYNSPVLVYWRQVQDLAAIIEGIILLVSIGREYGYGK